MSDQMSAAPVIVALPPQIDLTSQERAYDQLYTAFAFGATVVIADLTATTFCDCSSLRRLVAVERRAVARDAELRLVIPPGGPVRRLAQLMDLDHRVAIYPSVGHAAVAGKVPGMIMPEARHRTAARKVAMSDIIDLMEASCLHILGWQARLGELRRRGDGPPDPQVAGAWETAASLIVLHMRAEDEICAPAIAPSQGWAACRKLKDAHEDVREIIRETSLQPPGSPLWWQLAANALSAWAQQADQEEHGDLANWLRRADPVLRDQLTRPWRAFREACIRDQDQYRDAPPQLATCQLRLTIPAPPRLADPAFTPLACTCQACTQELARLPVLA